MATLEWHCRRTDGVTLVELLVESDVEARVRIESVLEPVWPPRRYGLPAEGWNDASYEGIVGPDRRLLLGYATPAEPVDPPAEIVSTEPGVETRSVDRLARARGIVRALGTARPARDVVRGSTTPAATAAPSVAAYDGPGSDTAVEDSPQPTASASGPASASGGRVASHVADGESCQPHGPSPPPSAIESLPGPTAASGTASETPPRREDPGKSMPADTEPTDDCGARSTGERRESFNCTDEPPPVDTIEAVDAPAEPHLHGAVVTEDRVETGAEFGTGTVETANVAESGGGRSEDIGTSEDSPLLDGPAVAERLGSEGDPAGTHSDPADPSLAAIERRVSAAEHLAGVTTVREAREAIERFGGIDALRTLQTDLARDRRALERAANRQESLAARLGRIEIPLSVLERLA